MTLEQQRIAIAEACGWEFIPSHDSWNGAVPEAWIDPHGEKHWQDMPLPDYLNDRNAIYKAQCAIMETFEQKCLFIILLLGITKGMDKGEVLGCWSCVIATEAQIAEAILRTIGKWKEESHE